MNGRKDVVLDDLLADEDGVLEVVTVPRHECDERVSTQRQFAAIGARAVRDDLALLHMVAFFDENLLIDAGRSVGTHELAHGINIHAVRRVMFDALLAFRHFAVVGDDDLASGDRGHLAGFFRHEDRA